MSQTQELNPDYTKSAVCSPPLTSFHFCSFPLRRQRDSVKETTKLSWSGNSCAGLFFSFTQRWLTVGNGCTLRCGSQTLFRHMGQILHADIIKVQTNRTQTHIFIYIHMYPYIKVKAAFIDAKEDHRSNWCIKTDVKHLNTHLQSRNFLPKNPFTQIDSLVIFIIRFDGSLWLASLALLAPKNLYAL